MKMKIYKLYGDKVVDSVTELLKIVSNEIVSEVADLENIPRHEHKNNLLGWKSSIDSVRNALSLETKLIITEMEEDRLYITSSEIVCYDTNSERSERTPTKEDGLIYKIGLDEIFSEPNSSKFVKETLLISLGYGKVMLAIDDTNCNTITRASKRIFLLPN